MDAYFVKITLPASETQDYGRDEDLLQIHSSKLLITNLVDDSGQKNSTRILASQFQTYKLSKFYHFGFQCKNVSAEAGGDGKKSQETSIPPLKYPHGFIDTITRSNTHLKKEGTTMFFGPLNTFFYDLAVENINTFIYKLHYVTCICNKSISSYAYIDRFIVQHDRG